MATATLTACTVRPIATRNALLGCLEREIDYRRMMLAYDLPHDARDAYRAFTPRQRKAIDDLICELLTDEDCRFFGYLIPADRFALYVAFGVGGVPIEGTPWTHCRESELTALSLVS